MTVHRLRVAAKSITFFIVCWRTAERNKKLSRNLFFPSELAFVYTLIFYFCSFCFFEGESIDIKKLSAIKVSLTRPDTSLFPFFSFRSQKFLPWTMDDTCDALESPRPVQPDYNWRLKRERFRRIDHLSLSLLCSRVSSCCVKHSARSLEPPNSPSQSSLQCSFFSSHLSREKKKQHNTVDAFQC